MGPVRMISSGHELTTDYDEKTLHELGFKDMQVTNYPHTLGSLHLGVNIRTLEPGFQSDRGLLGIAAFKGHFRLRRPYAAFT